MVTTNYIELQSYSVYSILTSLFEQNILPVLKTFVHLFYKSG